MKNFKYWTMILALGAAMAAPLYGCSSDDVDTPNKGGKDKTDAGTDADDDGEDGDGGEGGSGGEGGNGDGGNGGEGGSGGAPGTTCSGPYTGNAACDTCINEGCCDEKEACGEGSPCLALNDCLLEKCDGAPDVSACAQQQCGPELQAGYTDFDALSKCLCGATCQGVCGSMCK